MGEMSSFLKPASVEARTRLIMVTGVAGAGKTSALAALADLGFETVDNPPANLVKAIVDDYDGSGARLAIGIDERSRGFSTERCANVIAALRNRPDIDVTLVFLECSDEILLRRFQETRRRHPMGEGATLETALRKERAMLEPLRVHADIGIDTSDLSLTDLRREFSDRFGDGVEGLTVSVISFGFKRGAPRGSDMLFDMRFLGNPYWQPNLRDETGLNPQVRAFVERDPGFEPVFSKISDLILDLLPRYADEGKSYLNIAIGCTGGKHRSVVVAERLGSVIADAGYSPVVRHRDMPQKSKAGALQ